MWIEIINNGKSTFVNLSMASFIEEVDFSKKVIIANGQHSQCFECGTAENKVKLLNFLRACINDMQLENINKIKQIIIS